MPERRVLSPERAEALVHPGGGLDPLLVGKTSLDHLADLEALLDRGVLDPPRVRPRWLDEGEARLAQLTGALDVADVLLR